jgi:hypothetical protein
MVFTQLERINICFRPKNENTKKKTHISFENSHISILAHKSTLFLYSLVDKILSRIIE